MDEPKPVRCDFSLVPLPEEVFLSRSRKKHIHYKCPRCGAVRRCLPYWSRVGEGAWLLQAKFPHHYALKKKSSLSKTFSYQIDGEALRGMLYFARQRAKVLAHRMGA